MMRTRPRPSKMVTLGTKNGHVIHFGFEIGNGIVRFLCHSKNSDENLKYKKGKVDCSHCVRRYNTIQKHIKKYGVEWVCEGRWVPLEQRNYNDVFIGQ